jgi:hypothetical protein
MNRCGNSTLVSPDKRVLARQRKVQPSCAPRRRATLQHSPWSLTATSIVAFQINFKWRGRCGYAGGGWCCPFLGTQAAVTEPAAVVRDAAACVPRPGRRRTW